MNEPGNLKDFLVFVAEHKEWKPTYDFIARCARMNQAPTFAYTLPRGVVMADPRWLIFLTLSDDRPGDSMNLLREFIREFKAQYEFVSKLNDWVNDPISLVKDVAKWLSHVPQDEDRFAQALMNPNSAFIPFSEVIGVQFKKGIIAMRPHHIQVNLRDGGFIIYQDPATENAFKSLVGQFSGKWQVDFVNRLTQVARENAVRK